MADEALSHENSSTMIPFLCRLQHDHLLWGIWNHMFIDRVVQLEYLRDDRMWINRHDCDRARDLKFYDINREIGAFAGVYKIKTKMCDTEELSGFGWSEFEWWRIQVMVNFRQRSRIEIRKNPVLCLVISKIQSQNHTLSRIIEALQKRRPKIMPNIRLKRKKNVNQE